MKIKWIIVVLFIFLIFETYSQNLVFHHYNVKDGISQSVINCIFQDSEGLMWIGTQNGLNRFDGYKFETYTTKKDTNSISDNWIYAIAEDKAGKLWIGTKSGLNCYDKTTNQFRRFKHQSDNDNSIAGNYVYGVAIDKKGNIYANTPPILNLINSDTYKVSRFYTTIGQSTAIEDLQLPLICDKAGLIWVATKVGLASFNTEKKIFTNYLHQTGQDHTIPHNTIWALFQDNSDNIWIGTQNGLARYNPQTNNFQTYNLDENQAKVSNNFIRTIEQDGDNQIWVGTDGGGLKKLKFNSDFSKIEQIINYRYSAENVAFTPNNDFILSLHCDHSNNMWIGTLNGVDKTDLKRKKFRLYRNDDSPTAYNLIYNVIAGVYKDKSNRVWIGTWGKGLTILDRNNGKTTNYSTELGGKYKITNDFVHAIFEESTGTIWIGTRNGIQVYDSISEKFITLSDFYKTGKFPDLSGIRIYCIKQSMDKTIWVGTQNGLYSINLQDKSYQTYKSENNSISANLIYCLLEDKAGIIWIGTTEGLNYYNPKTRKISIIKRQENHENTLCDDFIVSLCEDYKGNIWIGTKNGVDCFSKKDSTFTYYAEKEGLPSNIVYEILEDSRKNLWFATGKGLAIFERQYNRFKTYNEEDGLQSLEFNLRASYKSRDGEVFFGGMNGLNSFYPDSLLTNNFKPPVIISSFEKISDNNRTKILIPQNKKLVLNHNERSFNIEFAALDYTFPQKNKYAYKLEGISNNWIEIGNRNFVPFSGLSDGKYVLKIKGSNNEGVWNDDGISVQIIVLPPWWRSTFAIIVYVILAVVMVWIFIKIRERNLVRERNILEEKVELRTAEIKKQKVEIEKSYENVKMLSEIGREITANLSIIKIIQTTFSKIHKLIDADGFGIGIYNPATDSLDFHNYIEKNQILPFSSDKVANINLLSAWCFNNQDTVFTSDIQIDYKNYVPNIVIPVGEFAHSIIYHPLRFLEKRIGVITIQSFKKNAFTEYHLNILKNIAVYTSIALENANAYHQIEIQKEEIAESHKQITDSINYARRIQEAIMPNRELVKKAFQDVFILFRPKDIVSGDFYWFSENITVLKDGSNQIIKLFIVADCTGHGVSGAFMTLLGNAFLNETINNQEIIEPDKILYELDNKVVTALKQTDFSKVQDGMDIGILAINETENKILYSGAKMSLCRISEGEIIRVKGSLATIGGTTINNQRKHYELNYFPLIHGDSYFLYSDGYQDQIGGEFGKKYMAQNFRKLLHQISVFPFSKQMEILDETLLNWKGTYQQVDDILVAGIKV